MTDPIIKLTPQERAELFYEVEKRRSLPALLIEKDFWVCWTLHHLFSLPDAGKHLVFKGGTSLSKAWGAIERFSEDIDISLSREWLGYAGELDPEAAPSKKKRNRLIENLAEACQLKIKEEILPHLSERFTEEIGSDGWQLEIDSVDPQTILFTYPSVMPKASDQGYVQRIVRIECGARSDRWPISEAKIQSYVADEFPAVRVERPSVFVLSIERTFWEKATILHAEAHRSLEKSVPLRFSRHYADLAAISRHPDGHKAIDRDDLLERVVEHKQIFFAQAWASYQTAKRGSFRLIPSEKHLKELEADYKAMREMYFREPPSWVEIISVLRELEKAINKS